MDTSAIALIASAAVSLLVPFLKKAGEEVSEKVAESAWGKVRQLYEDVKTKFSSKPDRARSITVLEKNPDDEVAQAAVRSHLRETMTADETFARELAILLKEVADMEVDNVFRPIIMGDVKNLIKIGSVFGDVIIH